MTTDEIKQLIAQYATDCGIDPGVAIAQAQRESGFRQDVIFGPTESSDGLGCRGLMQFCSGAWSQYGVGDFSNAFDIYSNLDAWCAYMQSLLARYSGDISKALMAYNGGMKRVDQGNPTLMAQQYANAILAQAPNISVPAAGVDTTVAANGGGGNGGGNGGGGSSIPTWLIVGGVALLVVVLARN